MALINPHVSFNGHAEEALNFYRSVFGGDFTNIIRFKDIASSQFPVSKKEENKFMNIALPIGKNFLIANDVPEFMGKVNENENRSKISISAESIEEGDKLFKELSEGGSIEVPFDKGFGNSYFGMFRDKFGIEWIINYSS